MKFFAWDLNIIDIQQLWWHHQREERLKNDAYEDQIKVFMNWKYYWTEQDSFNLEMIEITSLQNEMMSFIEERSTVTLAWEWHISSKVQGKPGFHPERIKWGMGSSQHSLKTAAYPGGKAGSRIPYLPSNGACAIIQVAVCPAAWEDGTQLWLVKSPNYDCIKDWVPLMSWQRRFVSIIGSCSNIIMDVCSGDGEDGTGLLPVKSSTIRT